MRWRSHTTLEWQGKENTREGGPQRDRCVNTSKGRGSGYSEVGRELRREPPEQRKRSTVHEPGTLGTQCHTGPQVPCLGNMVACT